MRQTETVETHACTTSRTRNRKLQVPQVSTASRYHGTACPSKKHRAGDMSDATCRYNRQVPQAVPRAGTYVIQALQTGTTGRCSKQPWQADTTRRHSLGPQTSTARMQSTLIWKAAGRDEPKANIIDNTSVFSGSNSRGVDELFEWLHAMASATSQGLVSLVLTFADKV